MADCSKQFINFFENITLTDKEENTLRQNRDSLRKKIGSYFSDQGLKQPTFCGQGSFSMKTTIREDNNEYDIDDGVYLTHLPDNKNEWPKTEEIHKLIINSVDNHTNQEIKDKNKCVRVPYSDGHHVDLAIYGECNQKYYLSVKGDTQWEENSAKSFKDWFDSNKVKYGNDFVNIIKAIKKWSQKQDFKNEITGFIITILVGENFYKNERIDNTLYSTLTNIVSDLKNNKKILRPVMPYKNLTEKYDCNEFEKKFINRFEEFELEAKKALSATDISEATSIWISLFGTDFPKNDTDEEVKESFYQISNQPKPWSYFSEKN